MANPLESLDLGKMIGPLPLGAWVATVGGGLAFMLYQRNQSPAVAEEAPVEYEDVSGVPGVGTGEVGGWIPTSPANGGMPNSVDTAPADNEQWARVAINHLIASNYNPGLADFAIRKYIGGDSLSASEFALVTVALAKLGSPPIPLPPPLFAAPGIPTSKPSTGTGQTTKPTTVTKPKPVSKPKITYYVVKPGDTLSKIGKKKGINWQTIFNANRKGKRRADGSNGMISNPNALRIGWKLIIPNN